jgi:hypothetical protein
MGYQHVYDAIKKVKDEGEAWVTWDGERLRLTRVEWRDEGCFDIPYLPEPFKARGVAGEQQDLDYSWFDAIVRTKRRGDVAQAECCTYKDCGSRIQVIMKGQKRRRLVGWNDILAVIVERHPKSKA